MSAHLWIKDDSGWAAARLSAERAALIVSPENQFVSLRRHVKGVGDAASVSLHRRSHAGDEVWVILASGEAHAFVNETPVLGMRVLEHRDAIRVGGAVAFFSSERLARVVAFPGAAEPIVCPRCRLPLETGQQAVCCPRCNVWHHQIPEPEQAPGHDQIPGRECWSYGTACACGCGQITKFSAGLEWSPQAL